MKLWQNNSINERIAMIQEAGHRNNLEDLVVEKDWWVTVTLKALFSTSFSDYLSFKGGTSLSKGWKEIDLERFSEDIDIALSRRWFQQSEEYANSYSFASCANNQQIKLLRKASRKVVFERLTSEMEQVLKEMGVSDFTLEKVTTNDTPQGAVNIESDRDPVVFNIIYNSILDETNEYIQPKVKVEISCLSMDEPIEQRNITSLVCDAFPDEDDSSTCLIPTVLPVRTFMEKAFLLNEEYQKKAPRFIRMTRHLYDLEKLMDKYADSALADDGLYHAIIEHRKKFYHISSVDYSSDERGQIRIVPTKSLMEEYRKDYELMKGSFIYDTVPLTFDELLKRIKMLEGKFNRTIQL